MYNLPEITEPVEKLEKLVRKEQAAQVQRRFHMLLLLKTGEARSRSAAARHLGVHRYTIADWLGLYEEGGMKKEVLRSFARSESRARIPVSSLFRRRS